MAQATNDITTIPLSQLFQNPFLRSAFERAERDNEAGECFAVTDHPPSLNSGAAELLTDSGARRVPALVEEGR